MSRTPNVGDLSGYDAQVERIVRRVVNEMLASERSKLQQVVDRSARAVASVQPSTGMSDDDPLPLATSADPGDSAEGARSDHEHPGPMVQQDGVDVDLATAFNLAGADVTVDGSGTAHIVIEPAPSGGTGGVGGAPVLVRQSMQLVGDDLTTGNNDFASPYEFDYASTLVRLHVAGSRVSGTGASTVTITVYKGSIAGGNECFQIVKNITLTDSWYATSTATVVNAGKDSLAAGDDVYVRVNISSGIHDLTVTLEWDTNVNGSAIAAGLYADRPTVGNANTWYFASDTATLWYDNGTTWILVSGQDGVRVRKAAGGMTCYLPSADTDAARGTALQAAISAAAAGDEVIVPPGDYAPSASMSLKAEMTLLLRSAVITAPNTSTDLFVADDVDGWRMVGGKLVGAGSISGGVYGDSSGVRVTGTCNNYSIERLLGQDFKGCGIALDGDYSAAAEARGMIRNCRFDNCSFGVNVQDGSEYCTITDCDAQTCTTAFYAGCGNALFTACTGVFCTTGLHIDGAITSNDGHGQVVGCRFNHNTYNAKFVDIETLGYSVIGCHLFAGKILIDDSDGIFFIGGQQGNGDIELSGVLADETQFLGVYFPQGRGTISDPDNQIGMVRFNHCHDISGEIGLIDFSSSMSPTGWSTLANQYGYYYRHGRIVYYQFTLNGTSNATTVTFQLPFAPAGPITFSGNQLITTYDNGVQLAQPGYVLLTAGSTTAQAFVDNANTAWTAANAKVLIGTLVYLAA